MHLHTHWTPMHAEQMPAWGARAWESDPAIIVVAKDADPFQS